jgi:hypothetical protein
MIIQLRRRHYYTWLILAILLPFGLVWAYFNIPEIKNITFSRNNPIAFPTIISSKQTDDLKVNLRENSEGKLQIEVIILQPLIGAANQLFLSNHAKNPNQILSDGVPLGSLASKGIYRFPMPENYVKNSKIYLEIIDVIKKKEVEKVVLEDVLK